MHLFKVLTLSVIFCFANSAFAQAKKPVNPKAVCATNGSLRTRKKIEPQIPPLLPKFRWILEKCENKLWKSLFTPPEVIQLYNQFKSIQFIRDEFVFFYGFPISVPEADLKTPAFLKRPPMEVKSRLFAIDPLNKVEDTKKGRAFVKKLKDQKLLLEEVD